MCLVHEGKIQTGHESEKCAVARLGPDPDGRFGQGYEASQDFPRPTRFPDHKRRLEDDV